MNIETVPGAATLYPHADALYAPSAPVLARPWESLRAYRYQPAPRAPIVVQDETDPAVRYAVWLEALRELGGDVTAMQLCAHPAIDSHVSKPEALRALRALTRAGHIKQYRVRENDNTKPGRVKLI